MTFPDRIALVGFMGSGKSTVGRLLAARLGYDFIDTDQLVEAKAGTSIARIFSEQGETAFRDLEAEVLQSLAVRARVVIAAGGGAPVRERNRGFFTRACRTLYLRTSLTTARERTGAGAGRPLLAQDGGRVKELYESRLSVYEQAGEPVDTDGRTPLQIVEEIISLLGNPTGNQAPGGTG